MFREAKEYSLREPELINMGSDFRINLYRKDTATDQNGVIDPKERDTNDTNDTKVGTNGTNEEAILRIFRTDPKATQKDVVEMLGISLATVKRLYSKRFIADRASLLSVDLGIDEKYKPIIEKCIMERIFRRRSEEDKKGGEIMKISELGDKWQTAYKQCLYSFKMREAAAIARHYRPTKIYKYYSLCSPYWSKNIFDFEIAFNVPSKFNDPLDSRWFLNYEDILKERFRDIGQEWSREKYGDINFTLYEEDLLYLRNKFLISCFSTTPHSNLMWGHYAEKHTGFCLEYDVALLPEEMQLVLPVVYVEKPYDASKILDMRGITDKYAPICPSLFKSMDWKYEKEWRVFIASNNIFDTKIIRAGGSITGIYFGLRSFEFCEQRNQIEAWANERNISIYQIERSYLSFDLISESMADIRSSNHMKGFLI